MAAIAAGRGLTGVSDTYRGTAITVADGLAWAVLDDLLIASTDRASLEAALDAEADARPSLADDAAYADAMRRLPADHLASAYLNLAGAAAEADVGAQLGGYSTVSAALLAEPDGLRLDAIAPFDSTAASAEDARRLRGRQRAVDAGRVAARRHPGQWRPSSTSQRAARSVEDGLAAQPDAPGIIDTLNQLRALAAFGLGINLDNDLLPLFSSRGGRRRCRTS